MEYRREIDGLRAVAVIPVILFHAGFEFFSGGFVGVDVFFVISGYLITTIILAEREQGSFSLINFYERRARRILPALFFVMLVCLPLAWFWLLPSDHKYFSKSLISVSLFSSNIIFWLESSYFDAASEMKPLLHTWSLAVEEQYYVFFPLFLMLVWRYRKRWILGAIILLGCVSLLLAQWGAFNKPTPTFYLLPTRAWELMIGASAAFYLLYGKSNNELIRQNSIIGELLGGIGLSLIILSVIFIDKSIPLPSFYTLIPTTGVVLIILFSTQSTFTGRLLGTPILVGVGLISYSLYLWHQPLFVFAKHSSMEDIHHWVYMFLIILTFALAYVSWRFIERPFRNRNTFNRKKIFLLSFMVSIFFVVIGLIGIYTDGFEGRKFWFSELSLYENNNRKLQHQSWNILRRLTGDKKYGVENNKYDSNLWFDYKSKKVPLLIVGNSHSKDIYNVLYNSELANDVFQLARYGVQIGKLGDLSHNFYSSKNYVDSEVVILASRYIKKDVIALPMIFKRILSDGKRMYIVKNIFEFEYNKSKFKNLADIELFKNCANSCLEDSYSQIVNTINKAYYKNFINPMYLRTETALLNNEIEKIASEYGVTLLNRMDYICSRESEECFAINRDFQKYFYDYGHHTLVGAKYFGGVMDKADIWKNTLFRDFD